MKNKKTTFQLWEVLLITGIASVIMSMSTGYAVYRNMAANDCRSLSKSKYINEFISSYNSILNNYFDEVDENSLIDAAIDGMLKYLGDPYTSYLNETSTDMLMNALNGTYEGIGIEVQNNAENQLEIVNVLENSPASKVGILSGDIIKSINGTLVDSKTPLEAVDIIKSSTTDKVSLMILREEAEHTFELTKSTLYVPATISKTFENNNQKVGYIYIDKFSDTITEQFTSSLTKLEETKIDCLIIDVRDNTGGYLSGATKIAEMFLEKNKLIYSLEGKSKTEKYKDSTEDKKTYKVYVLVNKNSASASEVLAAALKYSYGSLIIGTKTYGKGKVQSTSTLSDGTIMKYTSAKWLTPNGDCIDGVGLVPDIEIELSEEYNNNPTLETDNQLQTAIQEITK